MPSQWARFPCPQCGKIVQENWGKCFFCGADLSAEKDKLSVQRQAMKIAEPADSPVGPGQKEDFSTEAPEEVSAPLPIDTSPQPVTPTPPTKKKKKPISPAQPPNAPPEQTTTGATQPPIIKYEPVPPPVQRPKPKKKKTGIWWVIIVLLVCVAAGLLYYSGQFHNDNVLQTTVLPAIIRIFTPTTFPAAPDTPTVFLESPEMLPTPTVTQDLSIIDTDPKNFLLQQADLPKEGSYYLSGPTRMGKDTNELTIIQMGVAKGKDYVAKTGRVSGWWVIYDRGSLTAPMPREIICRVTLFRDASGAQTALQDYNVVASDPLTKWKLLPRMIALGDDNITYTLSDKSGGGSKMGYSLNFIYQNVLVNLDGLDYKQESILPELMDNLAGVVLMKLKLAPLVAPENALLAK